MGLTFVCRDFFLQEHLLLLERLNNNENSHTLGRGLHRRIVPGRDRRSAGGRAKFLHERSVSGVLASHARPTYGFLCLLDNRLILTEPCRGTMKREARLRMHHGVMDSTPRR